jgi:hypothetical protein
VVNLDVRNLKGVTGKLNLKGTFGGKTVSYSTTIETPSSSHPDLPLHRMAAKYQIKNKGRILKHISNRVLC